MLVWWTAAAAAADERAAALAALAEELGAREAEAAARAEAEAALGAASEAHAVALARAAQEWQADKENAVGDVRSHCDSVMSALSADVERLRGMLAERDSTIASAETYTRQLEAGAAQAERVIEGLRAELEAGRLGFENKLAAREADLIGAAAEERAEAEEARLEAVRAARAESEAARAELEAELSSMGQSLSELQHRFNERESRPEDLRRLAEMQQALKQREDVVKRAMEEMHYYKLELQNREENYNQLFGPGAVAKGQKGHGAPGPKGQNGGPGPPVPPSQQQQVAQSQGGLAGNMRVGLINPLSNSNTARNVPPGGKRPPLNPQANGNVLPKLPGANGQTAWGPGPAGGNGGNPKTGAPAAAMPAAIPPLGAAPRSQLHPTPPHSLPSSQHTSASASRELSREPTPPPAAGAGAPSAAPLTGAALNGALLAPAAAKGGGGLGGVRDGREIRRPSSGLGQAAAPAPAADFHSARPSSSGGAVRQWGASAA